MSEKRASVKKRIVQMANKLRVGKDGNNSFANYSYFKPDDIMKMLNPLLDEYDLITIFKLESHGDNYKATLRIEDCNSDEGVEYIFDILKATVKGANEAQNSGATLTYAKRYSLMNALNIADNDDDFDSDKMTAKARQIPQKTTTYIQPQKTAPATWTMSDSQRKLLMAKAKENGLSNDDIKIIIKHKFNKESSKDLTRQDFDELLKEIEKVKA